MALAAWVARVRQWRRWLSAVVIRRRRRHRRYHRRRLHHLCRRRHRRRRHHRPRRRAPCTWESGSAGTPLAPIGGCTTFTATTPRASAGSSARRRLIAHVLPTLRPARTAPITRDAKQPATGVAFSLWGQPSPLRDLDMRVTPLTAWRLRQHHRQLLQHRQSRRPLRLCHRHRRPLLLRRLHPCTPRLHLERNG